MRWAVFPPNQFKLVKGETREWKSVKDVHSFCARCNTHVWKRAAADGPYICAVGAFTTGPEPGAWRIPEDWVKSTIHLWYPDRVRDINDGLPHFVNAPVAFGGDGKEVH